MVAQHRQTWKLREYHLTVSSGTHCISGGAKSQSLGSGDPLKAFFPSGIRIHEHAGTAEVHEPGKPAPLSYTQPSAYGVENRGFECPEIQDIIVIGEVINELLILNYSHLLPRVILLGVNSMLLVGCDLATVLLVC
jgi:hypothetical protein